MSNKKLLNFIFSFLIFLALLLFYNDANIESEENSLLDPMEVIDVIDGDTIKLASGDKVRYIGIDTPESVHPSKPVECFAKEASIKNEELVLGKIVNLEKDVSEKDRYGRILAYVYVDDVFVNLELVSQGYAYAVTYPPDIKYQDVLQDGQNYAQKNKLGLWNKCNY